MNETEHPRISRKLLIGVGIYAILFFVIILISNIDEVNAWISVVNAILSPIVIGLVIAYLANPFFRFFERKLLLHVSPAALRRGLSLVLTYLALILIIGGLLLLIIPQLISSIQNFAQNFESYLAGVTEQLNGLISSLNQSLPSKADGSPAIPPLNSESFYNGVLGIWSTLLDAIKKNIRPENIGFITDFINRTGVVLANLVIGIFISIYMLSSKEKRYAQVMKFRRAYFSDQVNAGITRFCTIADDSFGGFLRGKLLDSTIVGALVYLTCLIFDIPYAILVAVIVGITDIVPIIGPFIGVIPTAIIILLTDPVKVIIFLISILVIQQIDGNIIAPKILGEHTGVSSLCVMIAILVMGDLLGLLGMVIGVPLFATVIELFKIFLDHRLRAKGLPEDVENYLPQDFTDSDKPDMNDLPEPIAAEGLPLEEHAHLRVYAMAKRHGLFSDLSDLTDEALNTYAQESARFAEVAADAAEELEEKDITEGIPFSTEEADGSNQADAQEPSPADEQTSEGGDNQ